MTSPWPESIFAFAPIWTALAQRCRVVAVDLPGFGGSERRDDLLSPRAMGDFLLELIAQSELDGPHLVAPDIGTSAALFAAASQPRLLSSLVVGSGGAAVPLQLEGRSRSGSSRSTRSVRAMDERAIVAAALDTIEGYALPLEIRDDYLDCYDGDGSSSRCATCVPTPTSSPKLAKRLSAIQISVQIIAGRRDRVVSLANAEFLHANLLNCRLAVLDAGHFVWEEAAGEYESIVADWAMGGYGDAAGTARG